jgi:hypothetical protein
LYPYNKHIFHESEFLQEIRNLSVCEETDHPLPASSGIVQPPASSVTSQNSEEASSKLVTPSDISHILDTRKTEADNASERRGSSRCGAAVLLTGSPCKNKLTEDLEQNVATYKKKASNDKMKDGTKQNQIHER